jgi:tRNA threonylcarbamoyl adenosine modification protein YeaZ
MTCLLAIDTATRYATVALAVAENANKSLVTSRSWFSQHNHGVELLPRINETLEEAGVLVSDLTHIAVVIGPGSFSALRVGLATAQGMALAKEIPIVPVPTFEVEIDSYADHDGPICAVVDAGSSGVAWGLYLQGKDGRSLKRKGLDTIQECAQICPDDTAFCGESAQKFFDYVASARILSSDAPTRGADALIKVAMRKLVAGELRDPSKVEITYARAPNISTPKPRLPDGSRR